MRKQSKDILEFVAALTGIVGIAWIISAWANSAVRKSRSPGQLSEQIAMICMLVVTACLSGAIILGIVRWINQRDDPRGRKPPDDSL